jgi:Nucleotidyl transferase AbiEii toxin, Type IV TA system
LDLSCNEWTKETAIVKLDDVDVLVYSLPLLAAEKLRALCQQMEDYPFANRPKARPRDFFDLHALVTDGGVNFKSPEFHGIVQNVFDAKKVDLILMAQIPNQVDFHFSGWEAVVGSIPPHASRDFNFYTRFLEQELEKLKPLWSE